MVGDGGDRPSVRLLGAFAICAGDRIVIDAGWNRRKAQALTKLLALEPRHSLHREAIYELLWPGFGGAAAVNNLRQTLHQVRREVARRGLASDVIVTSGESVALAPGVVTDLETFLALAERARVTRTDAALYDAALAAFGGELLPGDRFEPWTEPHRQRARSVHQKLLVERASLAESSAEADVAEACLQRALDAEPTDEAAQRALIGLHQRAGNRARALQQYERCREVLETELGVEPAAETRALYEAVVRGDEAPRSPVEPTAGPLVGRDGEMQRLRAAVDACSAGRGMSVFLLDGEPGIGKTRMLRECGRYALLGGSRVIRGRCAEGREAPPYWPWIEALRFLLVGEDPRVTAGWIRGLEGDLSQLATDLAPGHRDAPSAAPAEQARFRLFDAVAQLLGRAARNRALVVLLDDLHAADQASLRLLEFVVRALRDARVMVAGAYRTGDVGTEHPLSAMIAAVAREQVNHRMHLGPLDAAQSAEYVRAVAGPEVADDVVTRVFEQTGGNPFFLSEVAQVIAAREKSPGREARDLPVPPNVREVIRQRVRTLPAASREILDLAAICGRDFDVAVIAAMQSAPVADVLRALGAPEAMMLVAPAPGEPGTFRFSHALVTQTLYEDLPADRRIALHRAAGEAMERLHLTERPEDVSALARHFHEASLGAEGQAAAVVYLRAAARGAMSTYAWLEAARLSRLALGVIDRTAPPELRARCDVLLELGDAEDRAGHREAAREAYLEASRVAERIGDRDAFARAAVEFGTKLTFGDFGGPDEPLVELLERALTQWQPGEAAPTPARLLARLAMALQYTGEVERREALAAQAVAIARHLRDKQTLAYCLHALHSAFWTPAHLAERTPICDELLKLATELGDVELQFQAHAWSFGNRLAAGIPDGLEQTLAEMGRIAEDTRQPFYAWWTAAMSSAPPLWRGELDEAERLMKRATALGHEREAAPENLLMYTEGAVGYVLYGWQGRLSELPSEWLAMARAFPGGRTGVARVSAALGDLETARSELYAVADAGFPFPLDPNFLTTHSFAAEAIAELGEGRFAPVIYERLLPYAHLHCTLADVLYWEPVAHSLAILATAMHRYDDAERHFDAAIEMHERMGARPNLAQTRYEYARMLRCRGAPGDAERACELLAASAETARELGLHALTAKIAELPAG